VELAIRSGPRGARIDTVYIDIEEASGAYDTFSVTP
jgi:hypothetical protein